MSYEERVRLASLFIEDSGTTALVLVDEIINPVWQVYGPAPNLAYFIGTDTRIIKAQLWYDVDEMETAIRQWLD